jgi:hypothetical protein
VFGEAFDLLVPGATTGPGALALNAPQFGAISAAEF